jgi:hypothetical protein
MDAAVPNAEGDSADGITRLAAVAAARATECFPRSTLDRRGRRRRRWWARAMPIALIFFRRTSPETRTPGRTHQIVTVAGDLIAGDLTVGNLQPEAYIARDWS